MALAYLCLPGGGSGDGDYSNFLGTILNEANQVISKGGKEINKDIFKAPNGQDDGFIIINGERVNWSSHFHDADASELDSKTGFAP